MFVIFYRFLRIWSHLLEKSLIENFIFCAVLFKNWLPHSFNNGFHWQKNLNKRILFHLDRKGFYSFCFSWQKLKLGRTQFLKNNLILANGNGLQSFLLETCFFVFQQKSIFQRKFSFRLVETDSSTSGNNFFLLVETVAEAIFLKRRYYN